jgi:hypothetical protein
MRHKMHFSRILFYAYILRCYTVFRIIFLFYPIHLQIVLYIIVSYLNGDYSLCTGIISISHEENNFLYFSIPLQKKATQINWILSSVVDRDGIMSMRIRIPTQVLHMVKIETFLFTTVPGLHCFISLVSTKMAQNETIFSS